MKNSNFLLGENLMKVSISFNRRTITIACEQLGARGVNENGRIACAIKITGTKMADKLK